MKSGIVVSLDSNIEGSVSVVIDANAKKAAALTKVHFTDPKQVLLKGKNKKRTSSVINFFLLPSSSPLLLVCLTYFFFS